MNKTCKEVTEDIARLERKDIYVIVSEKGGIKGHGLVYEQEIGRADIKNLRKKIKHLKEVGYVGIFRIAKLVFIDEEE